MNKYDGDNNSQATFNENAYYPKKIPQTTSTLK